MKIKRAQLEMAMAKACLSVGELCENSGIARSTLIKIKAGKQAPKPVTVGKLAKALDCSVEYLTGLEE